MNDIVFAGIPRDAGEHVHGGCEVICASGRGEIACGVKKFAYKKGDVVVVSRQTAHVNSGADMCVLLENALLPACGVCVVGGRGAEEIAWVCARARAYREEGGRAAAVALDGLGALLRALIAAYCGGNDYSPAVKTVLAEIEKGVSDSTFSLENALRALPLNYDYVRKLFKSEVGQTPLAYLTGRRMSLAREIMLSGAANRYSDFTVSQISEMCGFAEPLYFSRVFKKYYGVSPAAFMAGGGE